MVGFNSPLDNPKEENEYLKKVIGLLQKENKSLQEENESLKKEIKDSKVMVFENNMYWKLKKDGSKEGPFCPICFDSDEKQIRLIRTAESFSSEAGWDCKRTGCLFNQIVQKKLDYNIPDLKRI